MNIGGKSLTVGLTAAALFLSAGAAAIAQTVEPIETVPVPLTPGTITSKFEDTYFGADPDFFTNRTFFRQLDFVFGLPNFLEQEITRDGREVMAVYRNVLAAQMSTGPFIRTLDLPNPYDQSLRLMPNAISTQPPATPPGPPLVDTAPPIMAPPTPEEPTTGEVPALW